MIVVNVLKLLMQELNRLSGRRRLICTGMFCLPGGTVVCPIHQVALLCFMTFVLSSSHNVLDAQTAFVSMALINLMGMPMAILPAALMFTVQVSGTEICAENSCSGLLTNVATSIC